MIRWRSTRDESGTAGREFSEALLAGLAPDGGLYVPEHFPKFDPGGFAQAVGTDAMARAARLLLEPFVAGGPLERGLPEICARAFDFPVPLRECPGRRGGLHSLELFHGPTNAFKDFGARFLAEAITELGGSSRRRTVLVATSGDTGGAVAAAFFGKPGMDVVILFPEGRISARQEKQLTAWGGNVRGISVAADFDACQRLAKEAFANSDARERFGWISANSINAGRLLPQAAYYALASSRFLADQGRLPSFVVPSGNLGNALACVWAREMGFPIARIILATNANRTVPDYFLTGQYAPRPTVATLANAMDVGAPSNFERLHSLYPDLKALQRFTGSISISDAEIRAAIAAGRQDYGQTWCPHTATAVVATEKLRPSDPIVVATAHPAKFETIVEPLIGESIAVPPQLEKILCRPSRSIRITPELKNLLAALE